ncbi:LacI family DNA-binding transcriptional regulator [Deferribacteres bacterium DY0037]
MKKKITITEIAKLAEVSPATVSLVLNGKPGVGPEAREKVLKIARANNYKGVTSSRLDRKHKTILFVNVVKHGQILNKNHKEFIADYIDGALNEAERNGYSLEVTAFDSFEPDSLIDHINSSFARGAVILATELKEEDIEHFLKAHIPVVFIDILYPYMPYDFVDMNNDSSVFNLMSHMHRMGHTEAGIVTGTYVTSNFEHRMHSFEKSMQILGMNFTKEHTYSVDSTYEKSYQDMCEILDKKPKLPSALFCVNDIIALGCMKALREHGYKIPDDISVIGFDNLTMSSMAEPPLTTVKVSKKRISMTAVKILLQRIKEGSKMPYEKVMIGGEVVERESVKQLNSGNEWGNHE